MFQNFKQSLKFWMTHFYIDDIFLLHNKVSLKLYPPTKATNKWYITKMIKV